jgi:putative redox protein
MVTTKVKWVEGKTFIGTSSSGHSIVISSGDAATAPNPMQLLLLGLGGCASIDIVEIMTKQRQRLTSLEVSVDGERGPELPRPWERIHMHFIVSGDGLDPVKVKRAVDLSVEKYCGVHATLSGVATITHDVEIRALEPASARA